MTRARAEAKPVLDALEARLRLNAAIAELSQNALSGGPLPELLRSLAECCVSSLKTACVAVYDLDLPHRTLTLRVASGWRSVELGHRSLLSEETHVGAAALADAPIVVTDFRREARFRGALPDTDEAAAAGVASAVTSVAGDRLGVLAVHDRKPRSFRQEEIDFLATVCSILSAAVARRRGEEALEESLKELADIRFALDASAIVAATDRRGRITFANDKFCEISRYSRAELLGQNHRIIKSGYHPKSFFADLWGTITKGNVWRGEIKNRTKTGNYYWVDTTIVPFLDSHGRPYRFVSIRNDITERMLAEERIREQAALLDISRDAILVRDAEDRIRYWNKGAERMYGWTAEEALGRQADELLFRDRSGLEFAKRSVAATGEWRGDLRQVTRSGDEIIVESRWTVLCDGGGEPLSKLVVNTDITESKRLEAELMRAAQMSLIGELSAGLAHEIKNPLAGIKGAVDILLRQQSPENPELVALEGIRHEVERIDATVHSLLSRARPRALQLAPVSLTEVVRRAVSLGRDQAAAAARLGRRVAVEMEEPAEPIHVNLDAASVEDAVLNLIINAIDATVEEGKVIVRLYLEEDENSHDAHAVIEVTDSGKGIAEESLNDIFKPFYTTSPRGTGLGLPAVRRIARAHGGRVTVRSKVGEGSTFTLRLPLHQGIE